MAKTTDELFAEATEADYETSTPVVLAASDTEEEFQFRIDEHLRTITIPEKGVVAGVEGDLNVNIARFTMVRYYHGRDLSKLNIRINYRNANGQVNYYTVSDATISGDSIVFSWEYAADVTQYKGNVQFVVYLFSATSAVLKQRFFTTLGTLEVLEGLEVDSSIPVSEQTDILLHLKKDLSAYAEEVKKSLPADYTAMTEQVNSLKEEIEKKTEASLFTLGINETDELLYIYYNGEIVGDGVNIDGATGVRYNVTYDLSYSVVSYNPKTIREGKTFTTVITAKDGFNVVSVAVTMSGKDITETSYVHGVITIQEVTGPITITVKTKALPKDLDNTKILNIDLTGWESKESILDSVTEKEYPIANKATKVFCNYYDSQKIAEEKVTQNGYTVAFVFDKTISNKAIFNSGIGNSYTKLVTGSYENFAALYSYGPFYNGTAAKNVYFIDNTSVVKWHENWDNLPDINNLIVSYGNDGIVKWYLNGMLIYTFECDGWSSWNGAGDNNFFNREGGVEISTDKCASMTRLTAYEGSVDATQAKQLSNFFSELVSPSDIVTVSSLAMQVGDTYTLKNYVVPSGFDFIANIESLDSSIVTVQDNVIKALKEGKTNLKLTCGDYEELLPVYIGTQIVNKNGLSFKTERELSDITLCNIPAELQVGDEWAIEGIGISKNDVAYDWYYDENALTYASNNTNVATIEFGVITARSAGDVVITVSNISHTFEKKYNLHIVDENKWWETINEEQTYRPTSVEATFEGFQKAIDDCKDGNCKKIIFPKNEYVLDPTKTPIQLPSDICIDFNNSVVKMKKDNSLVTSKTAYTTFKADNKDNLIIMNGIFYGECCYDWSKENPYPYHVEHELMFDICGGKRGRMINCEVSYGPGFSVNVGHGWLGNTRTAFKYDNVESGGLKDEGTNDDAATNTFRSKNFINLSRIDKTVPWTFGNFQGYGGYAYLYSRLFSIWFFDSEYKFIEKQMYLRQFAFYNMPQNAAYCKIEFYQKNAPTGYEGDFGGIAHIMNKPYNYAFKFDKCVFKRSVSTGLLAMGDMTIIDNCYFEDCGVIDPASSIDWEDGGQATHSCIVRHCKFKRTILGGAAEGWCALRSVNSSSLAWHDNIFDKTPIDIRSNTEWFRFYRNHINTTVGLSSKYDAVFAGNAMLSAPTIGTIEGSNSQIFNVDNTICIKN